LLPLAIVHRLSKFISDYLHQDAASSTLIVGPELSREAVRGIFQEKDLAQAERACQVVKSLVSQGADINDRAGYTEGAWELAIRHFEQVIDIRDDHLFPDWQRLACTLLLELFTCGADPQARVKRKIFSPYSGQLLADERSVLCVVDEASQSFARCRGAGVQQLLAAIASLRYQLVSTGAENEAFLGGQCIRKPLPSQRVFGDEQIIIPHSFPLASDSQDGPAGMRRVIDEREELSKDEQDQYTHISDSPSFNTKGGRGTRHFRGFMDNGSISNMNHMVRRFIRGE
jgi:hypothetical protein